MSCNDEFGHNDLAYNSLNIFVTLTTRTEISWEIIDYNGLYRQKTQTQITNFHDPFNHKN